jgi:ribonuclease HI
MSYVSANSPTLFSMFVDAVCFSNGYTAWGLSIHNQIGESIFSACKRESLSVEPVMAEALGIRWALQAAIDQGLSSVSISSDAENVVHCITKRATFASIEIIAQDCRELMNNLVNVSVSFVRREQNSEAHNLVSSKICRQ